MLYLSPVHILACVCPAGQNLVFEVKSLDTGLPVIHRRITCAWGVGHMAIGSGGSTVAKMKEPLLDKRLLSILDIVESI